MASPAERLVAAAPHLARGAVAGAIAGAGPRYGTFRLYSKNLSSVSCNDIHKNYRARERNTPPSNTCTGKIHQKGICRDEPLNDLDQFPLEPQSVA